MEHHKIIGIDLAKTFSFSLKSIIKEKTLGVKKSTELSYLTTSQI